MNMRHNIIRFLIAVVLAGVVADFIHIHVGIGVPTYDAFIQTISYLTKPEEAVGVAIFYYLMGDRLPTQSRIVKGIIISLILLLAEGQLIRQLLMNLLLPNTIKEALLFQSQVWLSKFAMVIIITLIIKPKYDSRSTPLNP
jgi:hypothetical protein